MEPAHSTSMHKRKKKNTSEGISVIPAQPVARFSTFSSIEFHGSDHQPHPETSARFIGRRMVPGKCPNGLKMPASLYTKCGNWKNAARKCRLNLEDIEGQGGIPAKFSPAASGAGNGGGKMGLIEEVLQSLPERIDELDAKVAENEREMQALRF